MPGATPTSLVPPETPVEPRPASLPDCMRAAGISDRTIYHVQHCGEDILALRYVDHPNRYKLVRITCKSRWCPACAKRRSATITAALTEYRPTHPCRLITLTRPHTHEPLHKQMNTLTADFRRLRARPAWKRHVFGGAFFVEITRNAATRTWHPHLHIIAEGLYFPHALLRQEWMNASGASIVDIRAIHNPNQLGGYVTKYVTKSLQPTPDMPPGALTTLIKATKSRRMVGTFGTWTKLRLLAKRDQPKLEPVGWLGELRLRAANGDRIAAALVAVADGMTLEDLACDATVLPPAANDPSHPWTDPDHEVAPP